MNVVHLQDCPYVPWRNGGGRTRELLVWPNAADWLLRVSVAEIEANGPFSPFPGVERAFAVLEGHGVVLALPGGDVTLRPGSNAVHFSGEVAPACRLVDGPTTDLNLMVRRDTGRASLRRSPTDSRRWRGLFAEGTLWWTDQSGAALPQRKGWWLGLEDL